ncbi:MAG TPA: GyrI-like domain-containing protein [Anaerolineales bacterium]|nr:GyrI-like domain-containing protein [Anaerolineales bacterium]
MAKRDLSPDLQALYFPSSKSPVMVDVPRMNYLMVDGEGHPQSGQAFARAITALYGLAYTLKFSLKKARRNFVVMPLEALWWNADSETFDMDRKSGWRWTAMMAMPYPITRGYFRLAVDQASAKKPEVDYGSIRLESWKEGRCAQVLHIGPYAAERPTIERLHAFIKAEGYRLRGKHHEIYIGDPNRSAPAKLKTVVRQPVERA